MTLSVIVPVFKVEKYIEKCLNSILEQDYKSFEVILINDGSPDNCPDICDLYAKKDHRVKVIHQKNGGLSNARNNGLSLAQGEYIWFIDSDDWIFENSFSIVVEELQKEEVEMLGFSALSFFENTNNYSEPYQLKKIKTTNGNNYIKENVVFNPAAWNYIYKKSFLIFHNLRFKENLIHEDDFFNLQAFAKVEKIKKIPHTLYCYRRRENSIFTSKITEQRLFSFLELLKLLVILKDSSLDKKFINIKVYNYISLLFLLIIEAKLKKEKIILLSNEVRKIIPFQKLYYDDAIGIKIEKLIYNFNINQYYKLKLFRS